MKNLLTLKCKSINSNIRIFYSDGHYDLITSTATIHIEASKVVNASMTVGNMFTKNKSIDCICFGSIVDPEFVLYANCPDLNSPGENYIQITQAQHAKILEFLTTIKENELSDNNR